MWGRLLGFRFEGDGMKAKKDKKDKIEIIDINKKTGQAVICIPLTMFSDISELYGQGDVDYEIDLKRSKDKNRKLLSSDEVESELYK